MTLVLFLISSSRSLGELEDVCVCSLALEPVLEKKQPSYWRATQLRAHEWAGEGAENTFAYYGWSVQAMGFFTEVLYLKNIAKRKKDCWLVLKGMLPSSLTPGSGCSRSRVLNGITEETKSLFKTTRYFGGLMAVAQAW